MKAVNDTPFVMNEIISTETHGDESFYVLHYWYHVFQDNSGVGKVRLGRLSLLTISDDVGNFKIQI